MLTKRQKIEDVITFSKEDVKGIQFLCNDVVVLYLNIANYDIHQALVDNESLVDILFYDASSKIGFTSDQLRKHNFPLVRLSRVAIPIEEIIILLITSGRVPQKAMAQLDFLVIKVPST